MCLHGPARAHTHTHASRSVHADTPVPHNPCVYHTHSHAHAHAHTHTHTHVCTCRRAEGMDHTHSNDRSTRADHRHTRIATCLLQWRAELHGQATSSVVLGLRARPGACSTAPVAPPSWACCTGAPNFARRAAAWPAVPPARDAGRRGKRQSVRAAEKRTQPLYASGSDLASDGAHALISSLRAGTNRHFSATSTADGAGEHAGPSVTAACHGMRSSLYFGHSV